MWLFPTKLKATKKVGLLCRKEKTCFGYEFILLPLVDIYIYIYFSFKTKKLSSHKIEMHLLIASEFIDICQRKGKDIFTEKS